VFKNIKLYYIHGYLSSPDSTKGTLLKKTLNVIPIKYRDCPPEKLKISECLENIKKVIENDSEAILIGSSLGGYLAAKTAQMNNNVKKLILLNPAIIPPDYDITKIKDMPQKILQNIQDPELFNLKISADITILIGKQDDVIPSSWPIKFGKKHKAWIEFYEDDHSFSKYLEKLPKIIQEIIE
jgi:predicted esterase YcpF (UPF0227 family)